MRKTPSVQYLVPFGMTTSALKNEISVLVKESPEPVVRTKSQTHRLSRHTVASRFVFLMICIAIVLSTLAYGTVHYWALAIFNLGALTLLVLWVVDAWQLRNLRISRNPLQLPLLGILVLGL